MNVPAASVLPTGVATDHDPRRSWNLSIELPSPRRPHAEVWTDHRVAAWRNHGERSPVAVWTVQQLVAFFAFAADDRLSALWWLIALRGLRRGEAAGLRWADVDLNGRVIVIGQQRIAYGHTIAVGPPKTASSRRVIALDRVTARLLRTHLRRQRAERHAAGGTRQDSGYVFTTPDGAPLHPDWPTRRFHRLVELSGLPPVRLHDLRHGAATLAHATGADLKTVQELLGHASIVLTTDTYTSVLLDLHFTTAEAAARLVLAAAARNPAKRHHRRPPASPPKSAAPPPTTGPQPKRPKRSRHGRGCQQGAPTHVPRAPHKDQGRIARKLYGLRSTGAPPGTRTPNPGLRVDRLGHAVGDNRCGPGRVPVSSRGVTVARGRGRGRWRVRVLVGAAVTALTVLLTTSVAAVPAGVRALELLQMNLCNSGEGGIKWSMHHHYFSAALRVSPPAFSIRAFPVAAH